MAQSPHEAIYREPSMAVVGSEGSVRWAAQSPHKAVCRKLLIAVVGSEGYVCWVARSPHEAICRELLIAGVGSELWVMGVLLGEFEWAIEEGGGEDRTGQDVRCRDVVEGC